MLLPSPAGAADLAVTLHEVANDEGHVLVAVCTPATFLRPECPYTARTAAAAGPVRVVLRWIALQSSGHECSMTSWAGSFQRAEC